MLRPHPHSPRTTTLVPATTPVRSLSMQSHSLDLTDAAGALQMAANRVAAVAQVHRNFYADEAEDVTVVGFLRRLCADLSRILDREIEVRGDEGAVPTILEIGRAHV